MERSLFSANFKKDYVAYSAIVIFFVIVIMELFMAIYIPVHLQSENVWAEQVSRQEMLDRFDNLRNRLYGFRSKDDRAEEEAKIILKTLNAFADYLRENEANMTQEQIAGCISCIGRLSVIENRLAKRGAYSSTIRLKTDNYIEILRRKLVKNKSEESGK
ncbi:hypothetical protein P0136_01785 [Lentisphaerota bacterium ZTH]|nr:hypothetical protein JYG24_07075 [Lentisphaerota bacterium]WET06743.1 hypothetical protein P0136_01785 [Lentisphaerota bacterium ZTH]